MSGQSFAWSWSTTSSPQAQGTIDPETIIALHEAKRAAEELTAKRQALVSDAAADPALVATLRAAAWARAGHEVRLVRPTNVGEAWDIDQRDIPEGWPASVSDPAVYVQEQLAAQGISHD